MSVKTTATSKGENAVPRKDREAHNAYERERAHRLWEDSRCVKCGKDAVPFRSMCEKHLRADTQRSQAKYQALKAEFKCASCKEPLPEHERGVNTRCPACRKVRAEAKRRYRMED